MVKVQKDLTGHFFGKLKVIKQIDDYVESSGKHLAYWLCECSCEKHTLVKVTGHELKRKNGRRSCGCDRKHKTNIYKLNTTYGIGITSNTNKEFYFDLEDYDKIKDYCWYEYVNPKTGYRSLRTRERGSRKSILMTALIGCQFYDHIDRNPLNCRHSNLRLATQQENASNKSRMKNNTSGVTGVYWIKSSQKWLANIGVKYQRIHLGYFTNKEDAIKTRLKAEVDYFGEFAPQKHLFEQYGINITQQNDLKE